MIRRPRPELTIDTSMSSVLIRGGLSGTQARPMAVSISYIEDARDYRRWSQVRGVPSRSPKCVGVGDRDCSAEYLLAPLWGSLVQQRR
jgi:hypothetical protein